MSLLVLSGCTAKEGPAVTEEQAAASRLACQFKAGAMASETLASDAPQGDRIPIDHVVMIIQENRSFDHYLSGLSHGGVTVAASDATNPDADGHPVARHHQTQLCTVDVEHSWQAVHEQLNDGRHDGFVRSNNPDGQRSMAYYGESELPFYYSLARTFAISDRHFCSVPGPTWPNRMFAWAATSFGLTTNDFPPDADPEGNPYPNIFSELERSKVSWNVYSAALASPAFFAGTFANNVTHYKEYEAFYADAANGTLPAFSLVEARHRGSDGLHADEHAPSDIQVGQAFVARVTKALMASPQWSKTALFITYDEHGGFYDSVPPPKTCKPDALTPYGRTENGFQPVDGAFDQLGPRVPFFVVSPYAKRGYVSHHVSDHTSVLRFIQTRFNMPAMTARDANADPLLDFFDFEHPDTSVPTLAEAVVDQTELTRCIQEYPDDNGE